MRFYKKNDKLDVVVYLLNIDKMNVLLEIYLEKIIKYVRRMIDLRTSSELCYHNIKHTKSVVRNATEMANFYGLKDKERFVLLAAAWFHDTGHLLGPMVNHEIRGVIIMEKFLGSLNVDADIIAEISNTIMATQASAKPTNLIEAILRDSDVYHLGTKDFRQMDELVWKEIEQSSEQMIADKLQKSLEFLNRHCFYTAYCRDRLLIGKKANIGYLESLIIRLPD